MKSRQILITVGAGFIGSHLADQLLERGHRVRVLDCLLPQVHGSARARPAYLHPEVELLVGDVRDAKAVRAALEDVEAVYHFATAVGVGQSMYELAHYASVNNLGTAVLLEALMQRPVKRLVVASSMSVYGEGLFRARDGNLVSGTDRSREQLHANQWEVLDYDNLSRPCVEQNLRWLQERHGERLDVEVADPRDAASVRRAVSHAAPSTCWRRCATSRWTRTSAPRASASAARWTSSAPTAAPRARRTSTCWTGRAATACAPRCSG